MKTIMLIIVIALALYACHSAFKLGFMRGYLKGRDDVKSGRRVTFEEFIKENRL